MNQCIELCPYPYTYFVRIEQHFEEYYFLMVRKELVMGVMSSCYIFRNYINVSLINELIYE